MGHPAFVAVWLWIKTPVSKNGIRVLVCTAGPDCGLFTSYVMKRRGEKKKKKKSCQLNVQHEMQIIESRGVTIQQTSLPSLQTPFDPPGTRNNPKSSRASFLSNLTRFFSFFFVHRFRIEHHVLTPLKPPFDSFRFFFQSKLWYTLMMFMSVFILCVCVCLFFFFLIKVVLPRYLPKCTKLW